MLLVKFHMLSHLKSRKCYITSLVEGNQSFVTIVGFSCGVLGDSSMGVNGEGSKGPLVLKWKTETPKQTRPVHNIKLFDENEVPWVEDFLHFLLSYVVAGTLIVHRWTTLEDEGHGYSMLVEVWCCPTAGRGPSDGPWGRVLPSYYR